MSRKHSSAPVKPTKPTDPILLNPTGEIECFELERTFEALDEVKFLTIYPSKRIAVYPASQAARERLEKQIIPGTKGVEVINTHAEYVESIAPGNHDDDEETLEA